MAKFMSVEMSEHRYPLRFEYYRIREGSGGAGWQRGGCGTAYGITVLSLCAVSIPGDRVNHQPPGIEGGGSAAPNEVRIVTGGQVWTPPLRSTAKRVRLQAGDSTRLASPGGGCFASSLHRDVQAVEDDLNAGLIGRAEAEGASGAVVASATSVGSRLHYALDHAATAAQRAARQP